MKTMRNYLALFIAVAALTIGACGGSDNDKDMTLPVISGDGIVANPVNCQVYHLGDTIRLSYLFTDNQELGNYHIEIHGNFDHHSHSTEADPHDHEGEGECPEEHGEEQRLLPDTAWVFGQTYRIDPGLRVHHAQQDIVVPRTFLAANTRCGDYHFMIRLTDRTGNQQLKAVAIKIEP